MGDGAPGITLRIQIPGGAVALFELISEKAGISVLGCFNGHIAFRLSMSDKD